MNKPQTYVGIHNDKFGGMTQIGQVIKDAWLFGLIPEEQTCEGWTLTALEQLHDKVTACWQGHGYRVADLPPELRERHTRIHEQAMQRARELGWDPEEDINSEE
ncbi:MAG: hypothetical protein RBT51_00440 [Ectothiorhodospiraceae bacterium]|jgi:hypothetical protein|nr:hypothetical protein [Ectothiorhodospiraceae bacterium]